MTVFLEDLCNAPLHPQAIQGLRLFNTSRYLLCKDCRSKSGKDLKIFDKNHHFWDDEKRRQEMRRKGWIR